MGSTMKKTVFDEQTSNALKKWHNAVKKRHGRSRSPTPLLSASPLTSPSPGNSTKPALHRYKTIGHSTQLSAGLGDGDLSDMESDMPSSSVTQKLIVKNSPDDQRNIEMTETQHADEPTTVDDFSFAKPKPSKRSASFK